MLPSVVSESLVTFFKYWSDGKVCEGVRHGDELYALLKTFPINERSQTYAVGCELAEQGKNVFIIRSKEAYSIWMNMRSPNSVAEKSMTAVHGDISRAEPFDLATPPSNPASHLNYAA